MLHSFQIITLTHTRANCINGITPLVRSKNATNRPGFPCPSI